MSRKDPLTDRPLGNAVKHGALAKALLRSSIEAEAECDEFLDAVRGELAPASILEETYFETIATCRSREARALLCEGGPIRRRQLVETDTQPMATLQTMPMGWDETEQYPDPFMLPEAEDFNKILDYETTIQRQLAYATNQLERLQRTQNGEQVLAPVAVHL